MAEKKETVKKAADKPKKDKPSIGARIKKFFRDYASELKKITWSPKKDVKNNTILVLVSIILVGVFIFLLDLIFSGGISLLGKLY